MTRNEFSEFCLAINDKTKNMSKDMRHGQLLFNLLHERFPDVANSIRGTSIDPFYRDENIKVCLNYILLKYVDT